MPSDSPKKLLKRTQMPKGDWDNWDTDTRAEAEHVALLFAQEYCKDFSPFNACCRLGVDPKQAGVVGTNLSHHWLVLHKIDEIQANFRKECFATADTVMGLLYRDASNFSPKANAMARVTAQKHLAQAMGLLKDKEEKKETQPSFTLNATGGVMVVPGLITPDQWGSAAEKQQAQLKEEVKQ